MRAPRYQPTTVASPPTTRARLAAANNGGGIAGGIGRGLQQVGRAGVQYATTQEFLNFQNDDTQARKIAADTSVKLGALTAEYQTLGTGEARARQQEFLDRADAIRNEALDTASGDRQRSFAEERLTPVLGRNTSQITRHAVIEAQKERAATFTVQEQSLVQNAIGANRPLVRDQLVSEAVKVRWERLEDQGFNQEEHAQMFAAEGRKVSNQVHDKVLDRMLAAPEPSVDAVFSYIEAYGDEMLEETVNLHLARIQSPLQQRQARSDADSVMSLVDALDVAETANVAGGADLDAITEQSESAGRRYGRDGKLLRSPVGAMGEMQVMPETARDPGFNIRPWDGEDPDDLARVGREYRAAMESRYEGDLAKMWAAYNAGPGRVDEAVEEHGGAWLLHMPPETKSYVRSNIEAVERSGGPSSFAEPREWDRTEIYGRIDEQVAAGDWSPERADRARREVDRMINRDEGLLRDQENDAADAIAEIILEKGEGFTSANMIPADVYGRASVQTRAQIDAVVKRNTAPKEVAANGSDAIGLELMQYYEPERFKSLNMVEYVGKVTPGELEGLMIKQAKMRTEGNEWSPRTRVSAAFGFEKRLNPDMDLKAEDDAAILSIMESQARAIYASNGNKQLSDDEYRQLFYNATREIKTPGYLWGEYSTPLFEVEADDVPLDKRGEIEQRLRDAQLPVTDENVLRLFRALP